MGQVLKNIVSFVGIPPAATVALPHGLNVSLRAVRPDLFKKITTGNFSVSFPNDTDVLVTNDGALPADIDVFVWYWYSPTRSLSSPPLEQFPDVIEIGGGAAVSGALPSNVDIFADSVAGNDANPGTAALPVQTFEAANALAPPLWRGYCRIHFAAAAVPYVITGAPFSIRHLAIGSGVGLDAQPMGWVGAFTNVFGNRISTAATPTLITDAALVMVPDAFVGGTVLILTGVAAGERRMIRENTVDTVLFNETIGGLVAGDLFRVETPAVTIEIQPQLAINAGGGGGATFTADLALQGIRFTNPNAGNAWGFSACRVVAEACEFDMNGGVLVFVDASSMCASSNEQASDMFSFQRFPAGIFVHDGFQLAVGENSVLFDYIILRSIQAIAFRQGQYELVAMDVRDVDFNIQDGSFFRHTDGGIFGRLRDSFPPFAAIDVLEGSLGSLIRGIDVGDVAGHFVRFRGRSYGVVDRCVNIPATTVTGHGIAATDMSQIEVTGPGVLTTVTGTGGDTLIGAATVAYAGLPFTDGATLCRGEPL